MKIVKRTFPIVLSAALIFGTATRIFAAESISNAASEKEEVVYITLTADGSMKNIYVVNSFDGGNITDYGNYASVKVLNTSDSIEQNEDSITLSSTAKKVYYQGELTNAQIPWNISLHYYLDGVEYTADELAGKSGHLEIHFQITENTACTGTFYEDYALQASFTLDTEQSINITAPDATIANVGSNKQLTYTILPGQGIDTTISADVADFEMSAVSINGIHLNLNVEIDNTELKEKVNALIDAMEQLDSGAENLSDGSVELQNGTYEVEDGASSLHSGITELDHGVVVLQNGLNTVQEGLSSLHGQSSILVNGSSEMKDALIAMQTAVNSLSVTNEELSELTKASNQIKQAISDLYDGAATLQKNLGYAQYKALMFQNGLDIDSLKTENTKAISNLNEQIAMLQKTLEQIANTPGMEEQISQLQTQISQLQQVVMLLEGNNAAIGGTESYLNNIASELPALTEGLATLKSQYDTFDTAIAQMVHTLSGMTGNLSTLSDGIHQLVEKYEELDTGIGEYTDGVAQIVAGYSQVMKGVSSLAEGSKELLSGSNELYNGTVELYDGVVSLCDGAKELADGTGELREETSDMNAQIDEKIDSLLESIGGSTDDPVSFVSEKNINVESVQFVIQTDAIEKQQAEESEPATEEKLSFWQKLMRLFGID